MVRQPEGTPPYLDRVIETAKAEVFDAFRKAVLRKALPFDLPDLDYAEARVEDTVRSLIPQTARLWAEWYGPDARQFWRHIDDFLWRLQTATYAEKLPDAVYAGRMMPLPSGLDRSQDRWQVTRQLFHEALERELAMKATP